MVGCDFLNSSLWPRVAQYFTSMSLFQKWQDVKKQITYLNSKEMYLNIRADSSKLEGDEKSQNRLTTVTLVLQA